MRYDHFVHFQFYFPEFTEFSEFRVRIYTRDPTPESSTPQAAIWHQVPVFQNQVSKNKIALTGNIVFMKWLMNKVKLIVKFRLS